MFQEKYNRHHSLSITAAEMEKDYIENKYKSTATIAISFIPYVGPFVSIGIGITDGICGEDLYNYVEEQ